MKALHEDQDSPVQVPSLYTKQVMSYLSLSSVPYKLRRLTYYCLKRHYGPLNFSAGNAIGYLLKKIMLIISFCNMFYRSSGIKNFDFHL